MLPRRRQNFRLPAAITKMSTSNANTGHSLTNQVPVARHQNIVPQVGKEKETAFGDGLFLATAYLVGKASSSLSLTPGRVWVELVRDRPL